MQINGQGAKDSPARPFSRLHRSFFYGKPSKTRPFATGTSPKKGRSEQGHAQATQNRLMETAAKHGFATPSFPVNSQSMLLLGLVLFVHAAALYLLTHVADIKMPAVSVPLQISFAISEPVQEKPIIKPRPKPQALADEPIQDRKPAEESQPQVTPPEYKVAHLNNPVPDYPALSRRLREQGDVILRVYVTPEGLPGQIELHTSSGHQRLDRAAQQAVERWKFVPARRGEDPVGAWVLVTINYVLS